MFLRRYWICQRSLFYNNFLRPSPGSFFVFKKVFIHPMSSVSSNYSMVNRRVCAYELKIVCVGVGVYANMFYSQKYRYNSSYFFYLPKQRSKKEFFTQKKNKISSYIAWLTRTV